MNGFPAESTTIALYRSDNTTTEVWIWDKINVIEIRGIKFHLSESDKKSLYDAISRIRHVEK